MKYRKKPVVIEAHQMTADETANSSNWPQWLQDAWDTGVFGLRSKASQVLSIETLEGPHTVSVDDWIIQGVKGELHPCKPDIFEMTYEQVAP